MKEKKQIKIENLDRLVHCFDFMIVVSAPFHKVLFLKQKPLGFGVLSELDPHRIGRGEKH